MKIGIPKEIKNQEYRVGLTPSGTYELVKNYHTVFIETNAGIGSGYTDEDYISNGAIILASGKEVYESSDMIVKVKEPLESEYHLIKPYQIIFTFFHLASNNILEEAMKNSDAHCMAYETVYKGDTLPILTPMSEIAGRMAVQEGAKYLEKPQGGSGVLLGGIPGVSPGKVLILGGGVVGINAAKMALGLGANVTIMDINLERLRYLNDILNIRTLFSNEFNIRKELTDSDLVIGAVLIPGKKAPSLIKKDMLSLMKSGSVIVDVAVDQGGCIETCEPTTHDRPTFLVDGIVHYCVANMPGAVPKTSTIGLTNVTFPYILEIANKGLRRALIDNDGLKKGLTKFR
jgi:alanine dehydrogenase